MRIMMVQQKLGRHQKQIKNLKFGKREILDGILIRIQNHQLILVGVLRDKKYSKTIKKLITSSIPDASIEIKDLMGDNNHYSALIKSKMFNGLSKIDQHKLVYKSLKGKMGNELHALSITTEGK